jgi:DNA modification methylase
MGRVERIGDATLYTGDVLECLREMPDESVHCIVTSPPYWGLRDYDLRPSVWDEDPECVHEWIDRRYYTEKSTGKNGAEAFSEAGEENAQRLKAARWRNDSICSKCGAWLGCHGLEPTPKLYVAHEVLIFSEVRRVLRPDGTLWLNLGDCYHSGDRGGYRNDSHRWENCPLQSQAKGTHLEAVSPNRLRQIGLKDKDLVGIPWRVAFALQADGWYLRSDIIWAKPNPMPESVTDRPTKAHEYLFLLSKSPHYFYDAEAIREKNTTTRSELLVFGERSDVNYPGHVADRRRSKKSDGWDTGDGGHGSIHRDGREHGKASEIRYGRNRRTVWTIATQPFPEAHFATFPEKLVEPCILAGCPAQICPECGAPWERVVEKRFIPQPDVSRTKGIKGAGNQKPMDASSGWDGFPRGSIQVNTLDFRPTCACGREDTVPGTVLDPFCGSGTALLVALHLGCRTIGIELKPEYMAMTHKRIAEEAAQMKMVLQ